MTFIVNGADWRFDDVAGDVVAQALDRFFDFARISKKRGEPIRLGEDFQSRPMRGDLTLWELFAPDAGLELPGEIRQELAVWLGPAKYYVDDDDWPDRVDETVIAIGGGTPAENVDVAWTHHCVRAGRAVACFTIGEGALVETVTTAGAAAVHFVADEASRRRFWRDAIVLEGDDANSLRRNAAHAFPDILFVDGVLGHLDRLAGGYLASRERVRATLAVLDDRGRWIFTCPPPVATPDERPPSALGALPPNRLVEARFAHFGLDAAPENPDVRLHRRSREARETTLAGRTLYCEWHVKLEPHRNRVHLHAPVPESGEKLVVAMIDEHLPLPG